MTDYTTVLKLVLPSFDQEPWDQDINNDLIILDAAVGQFFGVANLAGIWKNSIAYASGVSVVDSADGSMWTCVIGHTSPAAPTTFAQDRTTNPGRWVQIVSAARDYAVQAQNASSAASSSAASASNSATNAANSAAAANGALPLTGGTLSGALILSADPAVALGAATKQYVDARVGGVGYLPLAGGTLTGPLTLQANPTTALQAVTKQYADLKLPLAGGNLTGAVASSAQISAATLVSTGTVSAATTYYLGSVGYWTIGSSVVDMVFDANNWRLRYTRANGRLAYLRGSDNAELWAVDGNGIFAHASTVTSPTFSVSTTGMRMVGDGTYSYIYMDSGNWNLRYTRSTGGFNYMRSDGVSLFNITPQGNLIVPGVLEAGGGIYPYSADPSFVIYQGGSYRILQYGTSWYWAWNTANGDLTWTQPGGTWLWARGSDAYFLNMFGPVAGNGAYVNLSDEAAKDSTQPNPYGMNEVMLVDPIMFTRTGSTVQELGFSAQNVQQYIPEAVKQWSDEYLGISETMLISVLWNAMRQMDARVVALENK
jgi:hypothetical protein